MTTTTWAEIQGTFNTQTLGIGELETSEVELAARWVLNRIARRGDYWFMVTDDTITVGGNTSFALATELPGFKRMLSLTYDRSGTTQPITYLAPRVFENRSTGSGDWYTIKGGRLHIKLTESPTTLSVQYIDLRLVLDDDGTTKKLTPENTNDTFLFPEMYVDVLSLGMEARLYRRERQWQGSYPAAAKEFEQALTELDLKETTPIVRPRRGIGFYGNPDTDR